MGAQPSFEAAGVPGGYEIVKELVVAKPVGAPAPVTPAKEVCSPAQIIPSPLLLAESTDVNSIPYKLMKPGTVCFCSLSCLWQWWHNTYTGSVKD